MSRMGEYRARARLAAEDLSWTARAKCRTEGVPTELFFASDTTAARAVCARCPVAEKCRMAASYRAEPYGVWGGKSRAEPKRREYRDDLTDDEIVAAVGKLVAGLARDSWKEAG